MNIDKKDIRRIANGDIPEILSGKPFVVIRQSVHILGMTDVEWAWEISFSPDIDDSIEIPRSLALDIIRNNNMDLSHREACGQIYEMPGQPFLKKYEHTYSGQNRHEWEERSHHRKQNNNGSRRLAYT